jgi:sigma-B regulation protein RsbU (phosphoserine phosphatase)
MRRSSFTGYEWEQVESFKLSVSPTVNVALFRSESSSSKVTVGPILEPQQHLEDVISSAAKMPRILIVDDSRLQRKILSSLLTRWGFDVLQAASGEDALIQFSEFRPEIVLSDWMMPGMSGLQLCAECRALSDENYVYFILLTSKSEKNEVARGLDAGADDFLTKPVNKHELKSRLQAGGRILEMQAELTEKNRVINETLLELQQVYASLDHDLMQAKDLQQSLVPDRYCQLDQCNLSFDLRSCGHVGGDLVGQFQTSPSRLGLYAIDVSGHGIRSALMAARLAGYLSGSMLEQNIAVKPDGKGGFEPLSPIDSIRAMNNLVLNEMETELYFTMMLVDLDLDSGKARIGQAGHPHPVIQRADGTVEQVGTGGFPVGLLPDPHFSEFEVSLNAGDRLMILSDGVTECANPEGEMLGEDGLARVLWDLKDCQGPAFIEAFMWTLSEFAGHQDFQDDISSIVLDYTGDLA